MLNLDLLDCQVHPSQLEASSSAKLLKGHLSCIAENINTHKSKKIRPISNNFDESEAK